MATIKLLSKNVEQIDVIQEVVLSEVSQLNYLVMNKKQGVKMQLENKGNY